MRTRAPEGSFAASHDDRRTPTPDPTTASAAVLDHPLHRLQQTIGNQAVQRLLEARPAQPGLTGALTRFPKPIGSRLLQRDFKSDFEGKTSTPAAPNAPAPPGTVRVQTYADQTGTATWVDAPYGIYSPGEIPKEYHGQMMESGKAYQWRNDGRVNDVALERELERLENTGELTVGDMLSLSRKGGAKMNVRIAMAKVGNDFRFVGYDMSQGGPGGAVHSGFVESEQGTTGGVGRALFADRVTRALLNQAEGMSLEVYTSQRTAEFHAQIFAVAGRKGTPTEGQTYQLTTREMAKLAVAWNPKLTARQVSNLNELLARGDKVNAAEAEAALLRGAVQDPPGKSSGSSGGWDPTSGPPPAGRKGPNFKPQPYDPGRAKSNTTGAGKQANEQDAGTSVTKPGGTPPTGSSTKPADSSYTTGQRATAGVVLVAMGANIALNSLIASRNKKAIQAALDKLDPDLRQQRAAFPTLGILLVFRFSSAVDSGEGPTAAAGFEGAGFIPAPTRERAMQLWSSEDPSKTYEFAWLDPIDFSAQAPPSWDRIAEASLVDSDDIEFQMVGFRQHAIVGQKGFFGNGRYSVGSSKKAEIREHFRFLVLLMPSKIPYYDVGRRLDQMDVTVRDVYALGGLVPTLDVGSEGAVPVVPANDETARWFEQVKSHIEVDDKANALTPNSYIEHVAWLPPSQLRVIRFLDAGYEKRTAQRNRENQRAVEEMLKRNQEQARVREQQERERRRLEEEDERRRQEEQETPGAGAGSRSG